MAVLVLLEHDSHGIKQTSRSAIAAGQNWAKCMGWW
jgi:hypothetical protein